MEHFVVSARKYRPQTFKDVVGQHAITNTLENAIANNHLAQALLFTGPRGVGKTTCARILAKMINQDGTENPDEDFAFNIFELDAASNNSVDDIRSLIDQVRIPPQVGNYKVYIIDEVHMLSQAAFNAFLKTLEEPPKHAIFILATTEKHKIIPTILSRCQIFDFKRITVADAKEYLAFIADQQGVTAEDDALHIIAQKADGAMRDALSMFDRVVSFSGKDLTRQAVTENLNVLDHDTYFKATDLVLKNNIPDLLLHYNDVLGKGFDGHHFIAGLASHFRDLMVCKNEQTIGLLEVGEQTQRTYLEQSQKTSLPFLLKGIELANQCDLDYKTSKNKRLLVELCLMQLASLTFQGEKKNERPFLIPPSHFKVDAQRRAALMEKVIAKSEAASQEKHTPKTPQEAELPATIIESVQETVETETPTARAKPVQIPLEQTRVSGLSISSIRAQKAHQQKLAAQQSVTEALPKEAFTEEALRKAWDQYALKIKAKGEKILASIIKADVPKLKDDTVITLSMPNNSMKTELERASFPLLEFLKEELNNHDIELEVSVNESLQKKYAFTPQEKYEKLREKNPLIDKLRKEFDLDL